MGGSSISPSCSSSSPLTVGELVRKEVPDWEDEVISLARFKAFTGQRNDWEHRYLFWKDLILKVAGALGVCTINAFEVKNVWFVRGGLAPLCIEQVLVEMYNSGEIILKGELTDPRSGNFNHLIKRFASLVGLSRQSLTLDGECCLVLKALLQDRAESIIKNLSENHWTHHCIITMEKLHSACKTSDEACAMLSYLTQSGKAQYFSLKRMNFIEGMKVSLTEISTASISTLDYDVLHLVWTTERLQEQLEAIEKRWLRSKKLAAAALKSGNKVSAYRYIRQAKLFAHSRKKCTSFLERVEEVTHIILDTETTRKVSEAIEIGARAMKENGISLENVHQNLQEIAESVAHQKEVEDALDSASSKYMDVEEEDLEEEFSRLEEELEFEDHGKQKKPLFAEEAKAKDRKHQESADTTTPSHGPAVILSESLSKLNLEPA